MNENDGRVKRILCVVSGGTDSVLCLGKAVREVGPNNVHALTFAYNQRGMEHELECARKACDFYRVPHQVFEMDMKAIGGSALTDDSIDVPKQGRNPVKATGEIPITYVLGRNTIFIAVALAFAEKWDCDEISVGVNNVDYSGYPDCRPEYISAWQLLASLSSKRAVEGRPIRIIAPLQNMSKVDIVAEALRIDAPLLVTRSCYENTHSSCGQCESCRLRLDAFKANRALDPIPYEPGIAHDFSSMCSELATK